MKRSRFCIFNKQYDEETYWETVDALKCRMLEEGSYGEFFPAKFSPSGFQFSVGQLYFGYSESELRRVEASVFDPKQGQVLAPGVNEQTKMLDIDDLPQTLEEARAIIGKPILDREIGRQFAITRAEFEMYERERWSIPRRHFVSRLTDLVRVSNSPIKDDAACGSCSKQIITYKNFTFPKRKVYCRECYLKHLELSS